MLHLVLPLLLSVLQAPAFRTEVRVVRVDAEVREDNRLVDGLTERDFRVTDEGKPQQILYFGQSEEPLDLLLLFDTSGSMFPSVEQVAEVSHLALSELRAGDRVAVMAFDKRTDLVLDFTSDFAGVGAAIRNDVLRRPPVPNSQLQRGAADAARYFQEQPRSNRRRAVLMVTDNLGMSNEPRALREFWEADAVLSGVIVPGWAALARRQQLFPATWFGFGKIDGIVKKSGGDVVKARTHEEVGDGFRRLVAHLRLRYSLHYSMPEGRPGQERKIKVELTGDAARRHKDARVSARSGYVVPER